MATFANISTYSDDFEDGSRQGIWYGSLYYLTEANGFLNSAYVLNSGGPVGYWFRTGSSAYYATFNDGDSMYAYMDRALKMTNPNPYDASTTRLELLTYPLEDMAASILMIRVEYAYPQGYWRITYRENDASSYTTHNSNLSQGESYKHVRIRRDGLEAAVDLSEDGQSWVQAFVTTNMVQTWDTGTAPAIGFTGNTLTAIEQQGRWDNFGIPPVSASRPRIKFIITGR